MTMECLGNSKFKTHEAKAKSILRTDGIIDDKLIIKKLNDFRVTVTNWSKEAKEKYGIQERLFSEMQYGNRIKALPNKSAFKRIDNSEGIFYQREESTPSPVASNKTISLLKDFAKRIGVDINSVKTIVDAEGKKVDANGAALLMQKLIQVVEGKEVEALPEETMHFAVAILKQTNSKLYNKLLNEINNYSTLNEVFKTYGNDPSYQLDGKPNIIKLKEEAIGKVLADVIINKMEGSNEKASLIENTKTWWQNIIDFLKGLFTKSGFDQAALKILTGEDIGTAENINEEGTFLQKTKGESLFNKFKDIASTISKKDEVYYIGEKRIKKRVSDYSKQLYNRLKEQRELTSDEYDKEVDNLLKEKGTLGHKAKEYAFSRMVDPSTGLMRETELSDDDYNIDFPKNLYLILKENLKERLLSLSNKNTTRFLSEITVYDPRIDTAGTIDFMAITEDGKVHILDWKFMSLDVQKYDDISKYNVKSWRMQMDMYVNIVKNNYGLKLEDIGQSRMIPILTKYTNKNKKKNILPTLESVTIGAVNPKEITEDYLLPLSTETESTGVKEVDTMLRKLNNEYHTLENKTVGEDEWKYKAEELNALFKAIRHLQLKGDLNDLLYQAKVLNEAARRCIRKYKDVFEGKDANSFTEEQRNDYAREVGEYLNSLAIYTNLDIDLESIFEGEEANKELENDTQITSAQARKHLDRLKDLYAKFTSEQIGGSEDITNMLVPQKAVKGIRRWLATTTSLQVYTIQTFWKKINRAFTYADQDTLAENKKLDELRNEYTKWASSKGLTNKDFFKYIKKSDKNELIDEYNKEFYVSLKKKIKNDELSWVKDNIDVDAYRKHLDALLVKEIASLLDRNDIYTQEELNQIEKAKIEGVDKVPLPTKLRIKINNAKNLYNISTPTSSGWKNYNELRKFPLAKWKSNEWNELNKPENKIAKDFYNYIIEKNNEYADLGYISKKYARVFLPFVRRGLIEQVIMGEKVTLGEDFLRSISIDEGDIGYGERDPNTGEIINKIPKYFTRDIGGDVSEDLFRTMAYYNATALKYKYVKNLEYQAAALLNTERNKQAIDTSMFSNTKHNKETGEIEYNPDNSANTKLLQDMIKVIMYDQQFLSNDSFDVALAKIGKWGKKFNEKLGVNWFPESLSESQLSMNKSLNQLNKTMQMTTLGWNIVSSASNYFGGTSHSLINAWKYFSKTDHIKAELNNTMSLWNTEDKKIMVGLFEYFLPLTDDYNQEFSKRLSVSKITAENIQEALMFFMRKSDWHVQLTNFYAFMENTIVLEDKVVNVREYLREQDKYKDRYKGSKEERARLDEEFENDIKSLVEEKGIKKLAKIENNQLVIPGVSQKDESVVNIRRVVQYINKSALGNLTKDDNRKINTDALGKSAMVFKSWIPRLVEVRTGQLKYNVAADAFEWGRVRMIFRVFSDDLFKSMGRLRNALIANDKGVNYMRELYEQKREEWKRETGTELELTEADFMDLVRGNIKNEMVDVMFMLTLIGLVAAIKALPDDEEDPAVKQQYRFLVRTIDKFKDELSYFYDPTSATQLISKGIFPSITLLNNFTKFFKNFLIENYAIGVGDEELEKKTHVIKYWMKTFPIANQMIGYLPMVYPQLAKDLGVTINKNYSIQ